MNSLYNDKYYALTEQGDLGLGAEVLNESDQKIISEYKKRAEQDEKTEDE